MTWGVEHDAQIIRPGQASVHVGLFDAVRHQPAAFMQLRSSRLQPHRGDCCQQGCGAKIGNGIFDDPATLG
jgi:hypothetical protein